MEMSEWISVCFKEMKYVDIPQGFSLLNITQACTIV